MKFVCTRDNLHKGLTTVAHLAGKTVTLPILNNILIDARESEVVLSATNLEIGIETKVRGKVEETGKVTVPAKLITDYINLLKSDQVTLELIDNTIHIISDLNKTKINTTPADGFPLIPVPESVNLISLDSTNLCKAFSRVIFSASLDEMRPELTGVYMQFFKDSVILAATDSYRLSEQYISISSGVEKKIIVPLRTIHEVLRVSGDFQNDIKLILEDNQILFLINDTTIVSRLIEGTYPDYTQIIPNNNETFIVFDRDAMVDAVKVASLFTKSGINDLLLEVDSENAKVSLSTTNTQLGENVSHVDAEVKGKSDKVVFNWRYLLDGLQAVTTERAELSINTSNNPGVLKPVVKESSAESLDGKYLYLVMPIKQ